MIVMQKKKLLYFLFLIFALMPINISAQINYSISADYAYCMKWGHWKLRSDDFYYFDIPNNHSGAIQGNALLHLTQLFSGRKKWDNISLGISSELIYLPFSGLHYVDNEYLGEINGLDQWLHHYDHDRYRFIYMVTGIKAKYEIKNFGFVSFQKAYPLALFTSAQTQDLNINNKTGAFTYSPWESRSTDLTRNPNIFTELTIGLEMAKKNYFIFGYQWFERSSFKQTNDSVDNRHQAFRNVKIGWSISF